MTIISARATEVAPPLDPAAIAALAAQYAADWSANLELWCARTAPAGCYFDEAAADRACGFFPRYLRHTRGKWHGQPFELEAWQRAIERMAYGWKRADGTRRFRIVYIEIPRKNGKTSFAAGNALLLTFADGEPGAEVYSFANDTDQASIAFNEARRMISQSEPLRSRSLAYKKAIVVPRLQAAYRVLSADSGTKDGFNVSGLIGDELHALKDRLLYEVLHTATGARAQPLEFLITTAGADRHSFCFETHEHALKVQSGIVEDPEFLPCLFGADKDDDYEDPRVWAKANPSLGKTISVDYIAKEARRARQLPRYENEFKRLHLNVWTEQLVRWLPMDRWDAATQGPLDESSFAGRRCFGGLDLSSTRDINALALLFPREDEAGKLEEPFGCDVLLRFWLPGANVADREKRDGVPYRQWIESGLMFATDGDVSDQDAIKRQILADAAQFRIAELAYDDWGAHKLVTELMAENVLMVPIRQGFKTLSEPSKTLEKLIVQGRLDHGGHKVLRWMASNAVVETDAMENIKPTKDPKKAKGRIDGILAVVMALSRALVHQESGPSIYESRGLTAL